MKLTHPSVGSTSEFEMHAKHVATHTQKHSHTHTICEQTRDITPTLEKDIFSNVSFAGPRFKQKRDQL